jgi:Flp pilus assembly CpaE family ATPase
MLAEVQPNSKAAEAIRHLAEIVTGRHVQQVAKKSGLSFLPFLNRKAG